MGWFDFLKEMFVSRDSRDEAAAKAILRKRFNNNKSLEEEKYIYDHWKRLRIDAENCDVLNERATFDLQKIKDEHIGYHLYEQMLADENVNLVKLSCYDKNFSPAKAYRVTLIDYDAATVRAKLNVQDYIDVFIDPEKRFLALVSISTVFSTEKCVRSIPRVASKPILPKSARSNSFALHSISKG